MVPGLVLQLLIPVGGDARRWSIDWREGVAEQRGEAPPACAPFFLPLSVFVATPPLLPFSLGLRPIRLPPSPIPQAGFSKVTHEILFANPTASSQRSLWSSE